MKNKETFRSFVTGSHAYGTPKRNSDIDIVILVDGESLEQLSNLADPDSDEQEQKAKKLYAKLGCYSLRFGKVNLLCCTNLLAYKVWRKGTKKLKAVAPVTRKQACQLFTRLRDESGLNHPGISRNPHDPSEDIPF